MLIQRLSRAAGLCLFVLLLPFAALGQTTGAVSGTVGDVSGAAIAGARVTLTSLETGKQRTTITDAAGGFSFQLLPPSNYRVVASISGFKTATLDRLAVNITQTTAVELVLEPGPVSEKVTITIPTRPLEDG